ncbi:MAG: hypothetical protein K2W85_05320 [Phycisphaerales bacterium]|nr:hypothetical protein [Phycisphaerales bacterium]
MSPMRTVSCISVAAVLAAAGMALAQPAVNGRLKSEYGPIQWFNTTPTGFGNAGPAVAPPCDPIGGNVRVTLNNSNIAGVPGGFPPATLTAGEQADAAAVATGWEMKIPLEALGLDVTSNGANLPDPVVVRIGGAVFGDNYVTISNQVIGGLGATLPTAPINTYTNGNTIDFTTIPGNQFVTATIARSTLLALANGSEPTLDGTRDASYTNLFTQDTTTNFGNATTPQGGLDTIFRCQGGSEIAGVGARFGRDSTGDLCLYVVVTGNFESNFNKLGLFFDSIAGGQNQVRNDNATQTGVFGSITFGGANAVGGPGTGANPGLRFDAGFEPDYFVGLNNGGNVASPSIFADWQRLRTSPTNAGSARFIGGTQASANNGTIIASDPCPPFVPPNYADVANGSEINGVYAMVCGQFLHVLITGNLENNGNRLDLFFDAGQVSVPLPSNGQNRLQGNAHPFDFNHLNRLGTNPTNSIAEPGLRFSEGFFADYWMSLRTGGTTPNVSVDTWAGLISDFGASNDGGNPPKYTEYGSFKGGPKSTNNPIIFDGTGCVRFDAMGNCASNGLTSLFNPSSIVGIDVQGEFTINGLTTIDEPYSSFAPRLISRDVFNPFGVTVPGFPAPAHGNYAEPGLIHTAIDNSNHGGVSGSEASRARQVTTGMEIKIRLDELGYSGTGPIRLAGFIVNESHTIVSNQVIGGTLPANQANLNEPRILDFQAIAPVDFFVTLNPGTCTAVPTGACCFDATTCSIMSSAQCAAAAGIYSGNATVCDPIPCGSTPVGVCCRGATCNSTITQSACTTSGTQWGASFVSSATSCNSSGGTTAPCCFADYDKQSGIATGDIFAFLNDWFASSVFADVGGAGDATPDTNDIFTFLNAWFSGGC